jgi:hypothetical protein
MPETVIAKSKWKRRLFRWTRSAVTIYVLVVVLITAFQKYLIYPGASTQGKPDARLGPSSRYELLNLTTASGAHAAAIFAKASNISGDNNSAAKKPTVIFFYGNGSCMAYSTDTMEDFRHLGCNVMIPEYLGYGMSGGKVSETGCYETANAAYDYLLHRPEVDPKQIIVAGWSIGSAVAIDLAARKPVAGLVTFSAFTSMADMAHELYPWLPTSLMVTQKFESLKKIRTIGCPIFLAHGTRDSLVPSRMSQKLADAATSPVMVYHVQDGDHNDIFEMGGNALMDKVGKFIDSLPAVRGDQAAKAGI